MPDLRSKQLGLSVGAAGLLALLALGAFAQSPAPPLHPSVPSAGPGGSSQVRSNVFPPALIPDRDTRRPPPPVAPPSLEEGRMTNLASRLAVRSTGPGTFELGNVKLDREQRTVRFPALFNQERGGVEFLLVTPYGRTHESVLRTEVEPFQIHIAMLLLDARGSTNGASLAVPRRPGDPTQSAFGSAITGDPVAIEVAWKGSDGREVRRRAEELVINVRSGRPMETGDWTYSGSYVHEGIYRAQLEGTVASVIREPGAIINNPRPDSANDDIWAVNTNTIPVMNTPAEITLRLAK